MHPARLRLEPLEDRLTPYHVGGHEYVGTVTGTVSALIADGERVWWTVENEIRGVRKSDTSTVHIITVPGIRDLAYDGKFLYYVDGVGLRRLESSDAPTTPITTLSTDFGHPDNGLGGHPTYLAIGTGAQPFLYVTTASTLNRAVYRVDRMNGTTTRLPVDFLAEEIAAGGDRLAWIEPSRGRVESIISQRLLGTPDVIFDAASLGTPVGGAGPQTIATDSNGVYWVEGNGAVRRVAGGSLKTLATGTGGAHGSGLAIDPYGDGFVYFVNGNSIQYVPKNGGAVVTLIDGVTADFLAVDGTHVYWSNGTAIERFPKPQTTYLFPPPSLAPDPADQSFRAVAAGEGGGPIIRVYNRGVEQFTITAFDPAFTGGVRVAVADVNGDGTRDIIAVPGPGGGPIVRVFSGVDGSLLTEFAVLDGAFTGGLFVAAGDFNGDGRADVVISPDQGGGPRVQVRDANNGGAVLADFFGIEDTNFRGGARVAVGDLNGDGVPDLVVAAGFGGGPRLAGFDGKSLLNPIPAGQQPPKLFPDFFVFEQTLRNGVFVTAGDLDGDGFDDVIAGGGPGGGPRIFALSGRDLTAAGNAQTQLLNLFVGDPAQRGGVRVSVADFNGDGRADVVAAPGPGAPAQVFVVDGRTQALLDNFLPFPIDFLGGAFVAG